MKFNKVYVFVIIIVFAVAGVVIFSTMSGTKKTDAPPIGDGSQMPKDGTHEGMGSGMAGEPGSGNVKADILEKMAQLEKAANENPNDTVKLLEYAEFMGMAHKPDKAIDGYTRYLKINPNNVEVLIALSSLYYQKKEMDKSLEVISKAIKLDPKNSEAIFYLGFIEREKGDVAKAKATWQNLVKDFPGTPGAELAEKELAK
jgi:tetratricopeptide (TPR) repeat protein